MEDREILDLFFQRSQRALEELQQKYGGSMLRLARNILGNSGDAEECVNDACLGVWNTVPPRRPDPLLPYAYKIVRNLALKRYHWNTAQKRGGPGFDAAFSELEGCLSSPRAADPAAELDRKELIGFIEQFLDGLPPLDRTLFLERYWFGESHGALGKKLGLTENNAAVRLSRIRKKLKKHLEQKGAL